MAWRLLMVHLAPGTPGTPFSLWRPQVPNSPTFQASDGSCELLTNLSSYDVGALIK